MCVKFNFGIYFFATLKKRTLYLKNVHIRLKLYCFVNFLTHSCLIEIEKRNVHDIGHIEIQYIQNCNLLLLRDNQERQ